MPKTLDPVSTHELTERFLKLREDMNPRWGTMNALQMLAHCSTAVKMAFGETPVRLAFSPFKAAAARLLFIRLLPFPKNLPTAAELDPAKKLVVHRSFHEEREELLYQLNRLNNATEKEQFGNHPIFRQLDRRHWGQLIYKHLDHHLRQFGV